MRSLILCCFLLHVGTGLGQSIVDSTRIAWLGAYGKYISEGMSIDSTANGGSLAKIPLESGDLLISVNGTIVNNLQELRKSMRNVRENSELRIIYLRNGEKRKISISASPMPFVSDPEMNIVYGWAPFREGNLRTIAYSPKGVSKKIPFVLLIPGYNCGSIENFINSYNGKLIRQLVRAGIGVFTIEKSGIGDSYNCVPCEEVDLATDIESFQEGYSNMQKLPIADPAKLYIFGHSMGGVIAPFTANATQKNGIPPAGVIAFATVFRPWFEFLLEMHRVQAPLEGKSYTETETFVRQMQKVYYEFFVNKKSPATIAAIPDLKETAISEMDYKPNSTLLWGRHFKFWQQLDSIDLAGEWSAVDTRVLSIFGGADYIACAPLEHELLTKTVNASHPGYATHITIPDIDHIMVRNKDRAASMKHIADTNYMQVNYHKGLGEEIIKWILAKKP